MASSLLVLDLFAFSGFASLLSLLYLLIFFGFLLLAGREI
jgi:hypothetical protein